MDARPTYEQGRDRRALEVAALEGRSRAIGTARLVLAALALAMVGAVVWGHFGKGLWAALGADVAVFVGLVFVHARVHDAKERASAALRFHQRGLARLDHAWERLPETSARFRRAEHPFVADLDVFGRGSVMQLADGTETRFGEERLAALLSLEGRGDWPEGVRARQQAVQDLVARPAFREALATAGGILADEKPEATALLAWAEDERRLAVWLHPLGWALPLVTWGLIFLGLGAGITTLVVVAQLAIGGAIGLRVSAMLAVASARESGATRWRAMIALIEGEPFDAPLLRTLRDRLSAGSRKASVELAALERVMSFAEARHNEVFRLLIGPLFMWDVHCALALLRWRGRAGKHVRAWLEVLGEVEALASLSGLAFENPSFVWPELSEEPGMEGKALGHPLLPGDRRVGNDVALPRAGRALVVTGSNMSGKSTLLRALGVNALLAYAGAPVCASSMRIGPARVATSMRIEDSLEHGVSHFYAELRRLKHVLDLAQEEGLPPVLFLLDEILHGTNSRERVIGACAVVRDLVGRGALGAVSTHDLGITALERELGGVVENVHFEEQVSGETMTFDYVLRPGIVQSSNALRLMRAVGIAVATESD
ncbi:MAG TPA: MutS family DNA mismatch repair protein [Polyangiaceae bacterium]